MKLPLVVFAHGQESGPWGSKIQALAAIARKKGFEVKSPDYSVWKDPDARVDHLLSLSLTGRPLVLVGSSMGAYVATVASAVLRPQGLFLMAPAFYIPGYAHQAPKPEAEATVMVHGWQDEVVPVDHAVRYASQYQVTTHLLKARHRLTEVLPLIEKLFDLFLDERLVCFEASN